VFSPYTRIDYAVAQPSTVKGDTVLVLPGLYTDEVVDFLGKDLVVRSNGGAAVTTIQAPQGFTNPHAAVIFRGGETAAAVLEGFTVVTGGGELHTINWTSSIHEVGGGVYCSGASPTLRALHITRGYSRTFAGGGMFFDASSAVVMDCNLDGLGLTGALFGGGIYAQDSALLIGGTSISNWESDGPGGGLYSLDTDMHLVNVVVRNNVTFTGRGAGVFAAGGTLRLTSCEVIDSHSGDIGGGIHCSASLFEAQNCRFANNFTGGDYYAGGAIYDTSSRLRLFGCEFEGNRGQFGGAIYTTSNDALIEDSRFSANKAVVFATFVTCGGGVWCSGAAVISRCTFVENEATEQLSRGGAAIHGPAIVDHCTFVGNLAIPGQPSTFNGLGGGSLTNSIVLDASGMSLAVADVRYSLVEGGAPGIGNIALDPLFWGAPDDLGLLPGSPCIDVADPLAPLDPDGTRADMGAFPFDPYRCDVACTGPIGATLCTGVPNSSGARAHLQAFGSTAVADDRLVLVVNGVPTQQFGFFIASRYAGLQTLGGGSQGLLCLASPVLRFDRDILTDRGTGVVAYRPRPNAFPQGTVALPGEHWHFQYWFRDSNPGPTSNTSSAVRILLQ